MSIQEKHIIVVWDTSNYSSREAAECDGAVTEHEIPDTVRPENLDTYIGIFAHGLARAGQRLINNTHALAYEVITLKPFSVCGRVLEWNDYTVTVWAETGDKAVQTVKDGSLVSHSIEDVTYGVEGAPTSVISEKDIYLNS